MGPNTLRTMMVVLNGTKVSLASLSVRASAAYDGMEATMELRNGRHIASWYLECVRFSTQTVRPLNRLAPLQRPKFE